MYEVVSTLFRHPVYVYYYDFYYLFYIDFSITHAYKIVYFPTRSENTSSSSVKAVCSNIYLVNSKQMVGFEFHITAGILSLLNYVRMNQRSALRGEHC